LAQPIVLKRHSAKFGSKSTTGSLAKKKQAKRRAMSQPLPFARVCAAFSKRAGRAYIIGFFLRSFFSCHGSHIRQICVNASSTGMKIAYFFIDSSLRYSVLACVTARIIHDFQDNGSNQSAIIDLLISLISLAQKFPLSVARLARSCPKLTLCLL
jgi:hypothetical protein